VQALQQQIQDLTYQLRTKVVVEPHVLSTADSAVTTAQDHGGVAAVNLQKEVERANKKVSAVTDQLLRQQGLAESAKSEVLALKGRLQVALARAEAAEQRQQQQQQQQHMQQGDDLEGGGGSGGDGYLRRRRVKGGVGAMGGIGRGSHRSFGQLSTRNIRSSIGLRSASSSWQRLVGDTLDGLDAWLMETGHILRQEPLARLALVVYLTVLHLWCFGLIAYHTIQSERTGFETLADRSRIPHIHHNHHPSGVAVTAGPP
jgi:hypothetical protein